jgi:hypothetical protein
MILSKDRSALGLTNFEMGSVFVWAISSRISSKIILESVSNRRKCRNGCDSLRTKKWVIQARALADSLVVSFDESNIISDLQLSPDRELYMSHDLSLPLSKLKTNTNYTMPSQGRWLHNPLFTIILFRLWNLNSICTSALSVPRNFCSNWNSF